MYITDCQNINNCIACVGLYNKTYHILNKPVTQAEYSIVREKIIKDTKYREFLLEEYTALLERFPRKAIIIESSEGVYGNDIFNSKNASYCFSVRECEDIKNTYDGAGSKDVMDVNGDDL